MAADRQIIGQRDDPELPRFAGVATFGLLPRLEDVEHADLTVVGVPFDSGTSFRPGARFGPRPAFSADARQLFLAGDDGSVLAWNLDPHTWTTMACRLAGRALTEQEWHTYLPNRDFRPTCTS